MVWKTIHLQWVLTRYLSSRLNFRNAQWETVFVNQSQISLRNKVWKEPIKPLWFSLMLHLLIIVIIEVIIFTIKSSIVRQMIQRPKRFNFQYMKSSVFLCCRSCQHQIFEVITKKIKWYLTRQPIIYTSVSLTHSKRWRALFKNQIATHCAPFAIIISSLIWDSVGEIP